jgi:adenine-specific DNA-methyltransferase
MLTTRERRPLARLEQLIAEVPDNALRARLLGTATALSSRVNLGLNFERHVPEFVAVPGVAARVGALVAPNHVAHGQPYRVLSLDGDDAVCARDGAEAEPERFRRETLTTLKRTGEAIFPALQQVCTVGNPAGRAHHILIEGENHAVLQVLDWTHQGKIDCIYIDPPYNTGSKDWRYNNDFVDRNDAFKSSKWLSMMERRLLIARRLLAPDGVLVLAIDDYEYAHILMLLQSERLFRGWTLETVVIQHNPRGGGGNHISNTHEYAIFAVPPGRSLAPIERGVDELRDFRRRGRGDNNRRSGRPKSFFAILVDPASRKVTGVGPEIGKDDPYPTGLTSDGQLQIYPMGRDGLERVWRNTRVAVAEALVSGRLDLQCTRNDTIVQVIKGERKAVPIRSIWSGSKYNAGEQGTNLVEALTGVEFPYPKSIYTVLDCLKAVVGDRPEATVLDFFGGSGTTTHAVQLLNEVDGGSRCGILVTNNEVGDVAEKSLRAQGLMPGDDQWEGQGICRAVTFPRLRNAISGRRDDGAAVEWEFDLGAIVQAEEEVDVTILPFVGAPQAASPTARAALARYIGVSPKALKDAWPFYVPANAEGASRDSTAVLLSPESTDQFVEALAEAGEIAKIFVVSSGSDRRDREVSAIIRDSMGPRPVERVATRNASDGLQASLSYFRMKYLEPEAVEVGRQLDSLLPMIWLMAGGVGQVPKGQDWKRFLIPEDSRFALLIDEAGFREFREALRGRPDVAWAFIVCDSTEGFQQMCAALPEHIPPRNRVQLYRDYLNNFSINLADR